MKIFNQKLRKLGFIISFFVLNTSLFSQDIQVSMCKNTSSELRLQNALGIGVRYNQTIFTSWKLGLGVNRSESKNHFDEIPYSDASGPSIYGIGIRSYYSFTSFRFSIQKLLKNNDFVSISIGSVFSYNMVKGRDKELYGVDSITHSQIVSFQPYHLNYKGIGFISEVEVKQIFIKDLSLCVTIEPEALFSKEYGMAGRSNALPTVFGFTEFQVGLRYYLRPPKE